MPADWQASGTLLGVAGTGADISPVWPTHAIGDIGILLAASRDATQTCLTPSGWNLLAGPTGLTAWKAYAFWKRAASGAEGNPLCDWNAQTVDRYGQIHTIRGAISDGNPFVNPILHGDVTDPIVFTGGITTVQQKQLVIVAGIGSDNASASVTVTATDPASFTERHFSTITTGADATGTFHGAVRTDTGETGNITLDHNSTMPAFIALVAGIIEENPPGFRTTMRASGLAVAEAAIH